MPDYEMLELVLFAAVPRRDTKPLAKALLARFGSFAEVIARLLSAERPDLFTTPRSVEKRQKNRDQGERVGGGALEHHAGFSETADCIRSLSHLRDDFVCWNFLYLKFALNLIETLPMPACGNHKCRA